MFNAGLKNDFVNDNISKLISSHLKESVIYIFEFLIPFTLRAKWNEKCAKLKKHKKSLDQLDPRQRKTWKSWSYPCNVLSHEGMETFLDLNVEITSWRCNLIDKIATVVASLRCMFKCLNCVFVTFWMSNNYAIVIAWIYSHRLHCTHKFLSTPCNA